MRKQDFNEGWKVYKKGSDKKTDVRLPHDAMILEERKADHPSGSAGACFPGGIYCYEKTVDVPMEHQGKFMVLAFEGVYRNAKVYINDAEVGGTDYGYTPFTVDIGDHLKYGEENQIRVVADNSLQPGSRWYTGSGIYRPVWLYSGEKKHINYEGVKIRTLSIDPPRIEVSTEHTGGEVAVDIYFNGKIVASSKGERCQIDIPNAKLWSEESPDLYECHVTLKEGDRIVDMTIESFGIRTVTWRKRGLFINGKETLLRGGCVHHDNGILGARSYEESEERRVRIMKEAGYNAIRSAHNPASKAMLEACDRYGVYVMDETWDVWYGKKSRYDYSTQFFDNYKHDIHALIQRDYNHPSVIMYSIGNEVSEPGEQKGIELTKEMTEYIHSLDDTRAVTAGLNLFLIHKASKGKPIYNGEGGRDDEDKADKMGATGSLLFNIITSFIGTGMNKAANSKDADQVTTPCLDALDIAGYNYASGRYKKEGKLHPERILVGSETFPQDIYKNWEMVKELPYLIGDFMWTGWDYLGEAGMGSWSYANDGGGFEKPYPWILADGGAIDILGHVGAEAAYARTVWGLSDRPYIGVRPVNKPGIRARKSAWRGTNAIDSWSWNACDGNKAIVEVYANADKVKLLLNDKVIGTKKIKACKALFNIKYVPGILTAIAYHGNGNEVSRHQLTSAEGDVSIRIDVENECIKQDEVFYVDINIADRHGIVEANKDRELRVSVVGGELLAYGSANPRTEERYNSGRFTTYYGRSQAVIRAGSGDRLTIEVRGDGVPSMTNTIVLLKASVEGRK